MTFSSKRWLDNHAEGLAYCAGVAGFLALVGGGCWMLAVLEEADLHQFRERCLAVPKSPAECDLLVDLKRSSDSAAMAASAAAGAAIAAGGSR